MTGGSTSKRVSDSDMGETEEYTSHGKGRRRSQRKSSKVERLQITHSPSTQSIMSRRLQNVTASAQNPQSTGTPTPSTSTKPLSSTPQQSPYTGSYQNFLAQHRYGSGGGGVGAGGATVGLQAPTSLSSLLSWAVRGNGLRDIRDADIEDFLTNYWTTTLAVTSHALHRTLSVDNDVFNRAHNDLPWKDQGNIVFLCEGGKIVRAHGVLLNAILPRFVSDLMDIHKYVMVPTYNTSPNLPIFVKGIDARCVEHFLTLSNRSMTCMTGREIMQLKRMIEVLNIHELSVFVAHSGGILGNGLGAASGASNVLASGTAVTSAVASPCATQNFGTAASANQFTSINPMGSPFIASPRPRVRQSGQDLAAVKQSAEVRSLFQQENPDSGRKGKKKAIYANSSAGAPSLETSGNDSDIFELNVSTEKSASESSTPLKIQGSSSFVSPSPREMPPPPPVTSASGGGRLRKTKVARERKESPPPPQPLERKRRSTRVKSESSSDVKQRNSGGTAPEGDEEPKKKRASYSRELRDAALLALKTGATIAGVSEQFNVDSRTLSRWKYEDKRHGSEANVAAQNETTIDDPSVVQSGKGTDAAASTVNSPADVNSSSIVQTEVSTEPVAAETPTIGFDSVLMKDPPIGNYFNANPNTIFPQALHHSDLITFNNMAMAIHIPTSHEQNMSITLESERGKENVHNDVMERNAANPGPGPGRNPNLDMPTVVGMNLVVGSTNSNE